MKQNILTLVLLGIALALLGKRVLEIPLTPHGIVGLAIAVPSFLLLLLARIQLGRAFSVRAKATTLVTTGLYSRLRNPIYLFSALTIVGVILWAGKLWLLLILAVLVPLQIYRSRKEEQVLEEKFGADYLAYKQKTWF